MSILEVNSVTKKFAEKTAVDSVSFNVERGYIYGMVGPNGAGKTTTIRMIMNIIMPDAGSVLLFGQKMSDQLKAKIGYLPEERGLYPKMKVFDLIIFLAELHGLNKETAAGKAEKWLERFEFLEHKEKHIEELSKGMQQKIQLIGSFIHDPELIILDEPFAGLDPVNVNLVKDIMLELKKENKAIMLSTHMMEAAEKLCDEVLMINNGKKVLDGKLQQIQSEYGKNGLRLEYDGDGAFINSLPIVDKMNDFGQYAEIELKNEATPNDFLKAIINKVSVTKMEGYKSSLNEIFLELAGGGNE